MKTSIATVSISGNLREKLTAIAAAGFDGIEIFEQDFIADAASPKEIGAMVRDHGLDITLFQPFRDFEALPEPLRAKAFDRAERKFDVMQELGVPLLLICSSVHPKSLGGIERTAHDLFELGERAAKRGLFVGYEALCWGRHINDHRDAWEVVRRADHPNIGVILDSFHTLGRQISPDSIRSIPGDKIFFVQLADAPMIEMDLLYWSRHFRNMPGEGDLDVLGFTQAIAATGYSGPYSLEIFNDYFRGGNPTTETQDGYRSLVALLSDVGHAQPDSKYPAPHFPARSQPDGISFIEFASRGEEAKALAKQFSTLGFANVGTHVNKELNLWQQGNIRILINEETTGHAGATWNARGTCVCDLGIGVSDAQSVATRAEALGIDIHRSSPAPGELSIPAVRGLSGSILHFTDETPGLGDVWQVEFKAKENAKGVGLTRVDHVGVTVNFEDMLSWSLFFTTLLDVEKSPIIDVIDPDGIVRSQVVQSADGGFKITLNGADTHRTLAGSFLSETFGASVQHIALATEDIFETMRALGESGFATLAIPANYYDDLAARFNLPDELLKGMKSLNILYDEDTGGTFFQCYSQVIGSGFFFEIIQRSDSYTGFGAPNAPFRIAAQKRESQTKGLPRISR
ncbi:MAG: bifunctional sugar phosphate isomerase/epimerase/4-hydroxyphenylpyruvate dioxygenase family protein [Paracoccaceae bacterium]